MPRTKSASSPRSRPIKPYEAKPDLPAISSAKAVLEPISQKYGTDIDTDNDDETNNGHKTQSSPNKGKGTSWTGGDLKTLFRFMLNRDGRSWDVAVPGRTGNQSRQMWSKTIVPYIEKSLEARASGISQGLPLGV